MKTGARTNKQSASVEMRLYRIPRRTAELEDFCSRYARMSETSLKIVQLMSEGDDGIELKQYRGCGKTISLWKTIPMSSGHSILLNPSASRRWSPLTVWRL